MQTIQWMNQSSFSTSLIDWWHFNKRIPITKRIEGKHCCTKKTKTALWRRWITPFLPLSRVWLFLFFSISTIALNRRRLVLEHFFSYATDYAFVAELMCLSYVSVIFVRFVFHWLNESHCDGNIGFGIILNISGWPEFNGAMYKHLSITLSHKCVHPFFHEIPTYLDTS